ncbi:MAG: PKD domain-containing protein, partial [Bacteroidales bacterium]|nr:PKD domain-containing protein [Bacteroidales bacterium]
MNTSKINYLLTARKTMKLILLLLFLISGNTTYSQFSEKQKINTNPDYQNVSGQNDAEYTFTYKNDGNGLIYVSSNDNDGSANILSNPFSSPKSTFPYFDLRLIGVVTPSRDQVLATGPGWAFAALGSIESSWIRLGQGVYDLSEKNLLTCHDFDYNVCQPGNYEMATAYMSRAGGPISENDQPYTGINCSSGCSLFNYVPVAYVSDARYLPGDSATIRQALLDHGAVATTMYFDVNYYNNADFTYYYSGSTAANHGVLIVGWDDSKITAGGIGAWIVQNSRGESWGDDGYFYVSYYDTQFLTSNAIFPVKNPWLGNSAVYYYDKYGWIKNTGFSNAVGYGVIKFVAPTNHMIERIGTYATNSNTILDFEIYDDFDGVNLTNLLDTISNRLCPFPGYYTYDLDSPMAMNTGDDFYIKVKYNSPGITMPIPLESNSPGYVTNPVIETGKCWISDNGNNWTAIGVNTAELSDLCIKAYAIDTLQPIANFKPNKTSIFVGDSVNFQDQSSGNPATYSWVFTGGTPTNSNLQNPTNIVYNFPGTFNVTLSISSPTGNHTLTKYFLIEVNVVPPVAEFTSSATAIPNGGTVDFTDMSEGSPTTWAWNFPGGSPAFSSAQNPVNITYNTAGSYNVSLTITNALGTKTLTKYNYINVIQNGACGTISHIIAGDSSVNYTFIGPGVWGYLAGHNSFGMTRYADHYENTSTYSLRGLFAKIPLAYAAHTSSEITFKVWGEDTEGRPGNELYSKDVLINSLTPSNSSYNYIAFDSLFLINGNYFVGFTFNYSTPMDSIINNVMMNRPNTFNTAYLYENGEWKSFYQKFGGGLGFTSLDMQVDMCISPPTPFPYNVTGGGSYCFAGTGLDIGLDGSQTDATYELFLDGISTAITIPGTGNPLSFGLQIAVGTYTVVGTNPIGSNNMNGNAVITIVHPPVADFVANDTIIGIGDFVNFTDLSTNNPTSWTWTFIGGSPGNSLLQSPGNIQYNYLGFFDVLLIATNACGSSQMIKTDYIQVMPDDSLIVYGFLTYDNLLVPQTPMNDIKIYLNSFSQVTLDSALTDINGYYIFDSIAAGSSYILEPLYTKPWGGSNSGDALMIMLHFVGITTIPSGLPLLAADVSADGIVNSADALNVQQRFVGMITSYAAGDWVPTFDTIHFNGNSVLRNIEGLCFGDPNQSYIPPFVKSEAGVRVSNYDLIDIKAGELLSLPIRIENTLEIGAMSIIIDYDDNILKIKNVLVNGDSDNLLFHAVDGELRISWFGLNALNLQAGDLILTVECEINPDNIMMENIDNVLSFNIDRSTVFGDASGQKIPDVHISIPKVQIVADHTYSEFTLNNNYPNPFSSVTEITYTLPYPGIAKLQIFNMLGETVEVLVEQHQSAGNYKVIFNGSQLSSGVYYYMLELNSAETKL